VDHQFGKDTQFETAQNTVLICMDGSKNAKLKVKETRYNVDIMLVPLGEDQPRMGLTYGKWFWVIKLNPNKDSYLLCNMVDKSTWSYVSNWDSYLPSCT